MKRLFAAILIVLALGTAACGGGKTATPSPTSNEPAANLVDNPKSKILQPADRARDTVNQLNQQQNQQDQNTGSNAYNP